MAGPPSRFIGFFMRVLKGDEPEVTYVPMRLALGLMFVGRLRPRYLRQTANQCGEVTRPHRLDCE